VRDPAGNQFHRLSDPAYRFVALLDGKRSVQEAWDLAGGQLADDAPTQPEVIQILSQLYAANLIESDVTPDSSVLLRRHQNLMKKKMQGRLMNLLFPRIPIWDPDRFLKRWMPLAKIGFSKFGAMVWLLVIGFAMYQLAPQWDRLKTGAADAIAPGNWLWLWAVFVITKFIHEMGHAFSCRRFGGECHEMGIMFLVFIPTPYVDASSAWSFPSRWKRMFVGAAGMIVELFVAALCAIFWANGRDGELVTQLAYNAMIIASVSTVLFNANPLLRYDGYYMLSDFWEIPNLQQKSTEYALGLIKRHVFRVKQFNPLPPPLQRLQLFVYSILSTIYRVFVGVMIIILVSFSVPILGVLMGIGGLITWLVMPVVKVTKYLALEPELHRKRPRAVLFTGAVLTAVVLFVGMLPWWVHAEGTGVLVPRQRSVLHAGQEGFVEEIIAHDGQYLKAGDPILIARDPELDSQIAQLESRLKSMEIRRAQSGVLDPAQGRIDQISLDSIKNQLADAKDKQRKLTIVAPLAGRLIAPKLAELAGKYVARGEEIATIATLESLVVRVTINQRDYQLISQEPDAPAEVRLAGDIGTTLSGHNVELLKAADTRLASAALTHQAGGDIAADPRDPNGATAATPQFELRVTVDNPTEKYLPGQRAYVRLELEKRPLLWQWARRFWQLIDSQSGGKWM